MKHCIASIVALFLLALPVGLQGQSAVIDQVIARVGGEYILLSQLEEQFALTASQSNTPLPPQARCQMMDHLLVGKLLYNQSKLDSIEVGDDEVEQRHLLLGQGIGAVQAALLVGLLGASSVLSRVGFGSLVRRLGSFRLYRACLAIHAVAFSVWLFAGSSYALMVLFVVVLSYFGSKGNRARWIGGGCLLISLACLIIALPHFIFQETSVTVSRRLCLLR